MRRNLFFLERFWCAERHETGERRKLTRMEILKQKIGNDLIIAPKGRLDAQTAPEFGGVVNSLFAENPTNLIFDFDEVEYISSTGLRVLLAAQKEMNKRGAMSIINVDETVYETMEAVGFTGISDIFKKE
jgi:anti-sigma B factor antagonist